MMKLKKWIQPVVIAAILLTGFDQTDPNERLLILRVGTPVRLAGPGRIWHVPILEEYIRVNLDDSIAGWKSLEESELYGAVLEHVRSSRRTAR